MAITEKGGRPVSVMFASASECYVCQRITAEVCLVEPTLDACFVSAMPAVLIGDKAYDSDPLDTTLRCRGIEMIARIKRNVSVLWYRMVVDYAGISVATKWSVFSVGLRIFGVWS